MELKKKKFQPPKTPAIFNRFLEQVLKQYRPKLNLIPFSKSKGVERFFFRLYRPAAIALWRNIIFDPYYFKNYLERYLTLAHESIHVYDQSMDGVNYFLIKYLWPQFLQYGAPLGLLGFWRKPWFLATFLVFCRYLPARPRAKYELRALAMEAAILRELFGPTKGEARARQKLTEYIKYLHGDDYYRSRISTKDLRKMYEDIEEELPSEPIYRDIIAFTKKNRKSLKRMPEE